MGIPAGIIDKIFEPFMTTKSQGQGTGLGLATVAMIVERHGGFINVRSEVGQGTEFKVYIPAAGSDEAAHLEHGLPETRIGHTELILVVDDEASIRDIMTFLLTFRM